MRVVTATGIGEIDAEIASELKKNGIEVVGECYYREALLSLAQERRADIVIVSQHLPGEKEMIEVIKDLRMAGLRLILLPGRRDDESSLRLAGRAAALGVYDMIWDPVVPEKVAERVLNPATLAEAGVEPEGEAPVNVKSRKWNKSDKKESVYVVFGEHTEKVSNYLESRGYRVIGEDRTLDAAAIMALNLDERPDAYLILGSAQVCGAVDAGIDYGETLIESLKELKTAAPDSRIVLILPESVEPEVYQNILYMGIYDIYKTGSVSLEQLPKMLSARKDITDFGLNTLPVPAGKPGSREIALKTRKKDKKSRVVFRALTALVRTAFEKAAFISRKSLELKIDAFRPAGGAGKAQEAATESRPVKQEAPSKDEKEKFPEMPDSGARIREKATESEGRNRVAGAQYQKLKVLLLGQKVSSLGPQLLEQGLEVATDPVDAAVVVADAQGFGFAPADKPLVVLGTGTIVDFAVKKSRPDAKVVKDPESVVDALMEMLEKPKPVKNLKVFPGGRSERGQSLALHSALYVVCPSRPGQAGEVAANMAKTVDGCALVCAAPESTGALALGIPEGDLICSDWRIPGSDAPVKWGGVTVWPVDPFKFLNVKDASAHALVEQIKPKFNLVVVDCAGNLEIASRAPKTDGVIVLHKEGDTADAATSYWLKNYAGSNVFVMSPSEVPDVLSVENGFVMVKRRAESAEGNIKR